MGHLRCSGPLPHSDICYPGAHGNILLHYSCVYLVRGITSLTLLIRQRRTGETLRDFMTFALKVEVMPTEISTGFSSFDFWGGTAAAWIAWRWWGLMEAELPVCLSASVHWEIIARSESRAFIQGPWLVVLKPGGSVVIQQQRGLEIDGESKTKGKGENRKKGKGTKRRRAWVARWIGAVILLLQQNHAMDF